MPDHDFAPASFSVADELRKLSELHDSHVLTDDEFQTGKASLLRNSPAVGDPLSRPFHDQSPRTTEVKASGWRHWRRMTWAIWAWSAVCLIWLVVGMVSVSNAHPSCNGLSTSTCQAATAVGAGIGATFIVIVWFFVFLVLSIIWFMTRPRA